MAGTHQVERISVRPINDFTDQALDCGGGFRFPARQLAIQLLGNGSHMEKLSEPNAPVNL